MKILFLDQFSEPGGAQQQLLDLLPGVRDRGWEMELAMPGSGPMFEKVRREGAAVSMLPAACATRGPGFLRDTRAIARFTESRAADVIFVNGPRMMPAASLGARGRPVVFHAHNRLDGLPARFTRWAVRRARARVISVCRFVAQTIDPDRRGSVIYNGVSDFGFAPVRGRIERIGVIGRIAPEKGQREFLNAAKLLSDRFHYVICGAALFSDAEYETGVRAAARGLPVEFTGWVDDVAPVLRSLALLVVPSVAEPATARVIVEAFSAGVPVVAFPTGGIPEVIEDGRTGFLTGRVTADSLADGIRRAIASNLGAVSTAARREYEARFTIERFRNEVLEVVAQVASRVK